MRRYITLLFILCIAACTKKEIQDVQADSFRISILPALNPAFNQYIFSGTLDVRQVMGSVEYGLVAGKTLNPDISHDKVFKAGTATGSADFVQVVAGLDTGSVYYVRAYARSGSETQYSANQTIAKLSPRFYLNSTALQYGQTFTFATNFNGTGTNDLPVVRLNKTQVKVTGGPANDNTAMVLSLVPPDELPVGAYTLTVEIGGVKVTYPTPLNLLEGHWSQPYLLPRDYAFAFIYDRFVNGDWIYSSQADSNGPSFSRYNYKTGETQSLASLSAQDIVRGAAMFQDGNNLHVLGGELIANGSPNRPTSNAHWIYSFTNGTWTRQADLPGRSRQSGALLQVGSRLYYGLGSDFSVASSGYYSGLDDLWGYDPGTQQWQQLANFPGTAKYARAYFSLGNKLYVVGGNSNQGTAVKECWCYDPTTNQWTAKADYPGSGWINLITFTIGNYAYTGTGETSSYNSYSGRNLFPNIYKYDATGNKWTEISNFGGNVVQPFVGYTGSSVLVGAGLDATSFASRYIFEFKP